jgi:hypothetical protein
MDVCQPFPTGYDEFKRLGRFIKTLDRLHQIGYYPPTKERTTEYE